MTAIVDTFVLIQNAHATATQLDSTVGKWIDDDGEDIERRAEILQRIRQARTALADVEAIIEANVARLMKSNKVDLDKYQLIRRGGSKIVWTPESLTTAIGWAIEARFTAATGVIADGFDLDTAYAVRDFVMELYGSATIKTTPLKELGVDYGELITREKTRRTVQVNDKSATSEQAAS